MKWIKEKLLYIVLIYINFNLILRLIEKSIFIKNFNYAFTSLLFLIGFFIYWFYNYLLRKGIYKTLFTILIFGAGGLYYLKKSEFVMSMFNNYVMKNINILDKLIYKGATTYFYQYKIIFMLSIPLIIALILWITFRFMKKFILVVSVAIVITLWFSNCDAVVKEHLFIYIFISSMTFIIMSYIKRIQQYRNEGVKISLKFGHILIYGVIASLIISKITISLPQEYKGRDLSSFGNYFENKFASKSSGMSSANKNRYTLSSSGYTGNDKRLGGPISINYREVFKVKSDRPYYLKGNVVDFYDGNSWQKSYENYHEKQDSSDMQYINYGVRITDIKNSMTIYPNEKFKTNTIFVPNYTFNVRDVATPLFYDKAPTVLSEKIVTKPYSVDFYKDMETIDTIEHVNDFTKKTLKLNPPPQGRYILPMEYLLQPNPDYLKTFTNKNAIIEDRFLYRNSEDFKIIKDYGEYLQVPGNISNRTYELVKEITKNSYTSLDKVLEIKKYLTKNYVYDLQVSEVPKNSEFVDYFLFVEKKGYCTYFNTAMTVMCRIAGVPARYVEGFKSPSKTDNSGFYVVTNAEAHAWCEVLLGGGIYSNIWTIADASPTASEDLQRKLKELQEQQKNNSDSGDVNINMKRTPQNKLDDIEAAGAGGESKIKILSDMQLRVINILTVVILFFLMRITKVMQKKSKLLKSKGVTPLYNYYIYRLAVIRIVKPEHQGDLEFVLELPNSEIKERMKILVEGAYEEFYGKHSEMEINNKEYYEFLERYLKEYQGRTQYLLKKYLGIF